MNARMRRRARLPGTGAKAASAFSAMCSALVVSVSTQVTAGFARMYCSENCAQLVHSNSAAQSGSGTFASRSKYAPFMNGRLISTAMPRSAQQRQQPFGVALRHGVIDLDEVGPLARDERLELSVQRRLRGRDADVARAAVILERAQVRPLRVEVDEAADVDEIDALAPVQPQRALEVRAPGLGALLLEVDRDEQPVAQAPAR